MKPRLNPESSQRDLFRASFDQILNAEHPLVVLAQKIDWSRFEVAMAECYSPDLGAPAKATRLMVGLVYLKHAFNESDESLLLRWVENPYWQSFCGFTTMQHDPPIHPTALVKWRQRVGAERLALLLQETIDVGQREQQIKPSELEHVNIDTTVGEKNITYPTDSKLLLRAIEKLGALARRRGIALRQSYARVAKHTAQQAGRYAHAKQFKRMRRSLKKLRTWLGRLIRDIRRKHTGPDVGLDSLLALCERVRTQQRFDKNKLYSLHEPEVVCISKGKARVRYEFGQKIAVATTNRQNWIVGIRLCEDNPYDGHTLSDTLDTVRSTTGRCVSHAYVDKGYRGHGYDGPTQIHIAGSSERGLSRLMRKRRRRRSAVEPKIGHLKSDNRLGRCFLRGLTGDAINAVLAAAGSNLRKLLQGLVFALINWLRLRFTLGPQDLSVPRANFKTRSNLVLSQTI